MEEKQQKKTAKFIKAELLPLFVGLRDELKDFNKIAKQLLAKEFPAIQKVKEQNPIEMPKEVKVSNLPDIQKVENITPPQKEIEVKGLQLLFANTWSKVYTIGDIFAEHIAKAWKEIAPHIFKVEVQNQKDIQKVEVINPPAKQDPPVVNVPDSVFIKNSEPREAIPVILTMKDRRNFYESMMQLVGVTDINLSGIKDKLDDLKTAIEDITIDIGDVTVNLDDLEKLNGQTLKDAFGEVAVSPSTETVIATLTVATGKKLRLHGVFGESDADIIFRLYLNTTKKWQARNAWTQRNVQAIIEIEAPVAGDKIELRAFHTRPLTHTVSGHIYAYEI